ncbi:RimK family alpha-L-glutamate ligase [Aminivibrio sp.]|uniref:RimK family alpha-L-glutamate ligase n=1 Tax=Aminivibrio sp. TaxID=1872489 RepID=UPI00345EE450
MAHFFIFYTRLRTEEKLLFRAAEDKGIPFSAVNLSDGFWPNVPGEAGDVALCRCVSQTQNSALAVLLEARGVLTVNSSGVMGLCADKIVTAAKLSAAGIPQPEYAVAFSPEGAADGAERLGYPLVIKPATGSWGRLLAKVNDRDALEAVAEHKAHMGAANSVLFMQQYVEKKGFDLRATLLGGEVLTVIKRCSDHWITNTARGATPGKYPLSPEIRALLDRVQNAIGGEVLAVDLFEKPEGGWMVNEVNGQPEFRSSDGELTGVDIAGRLVEHVWSLASGTGGTKG